MKTLRFRILLLALALAAGVAFSSASAQTSNSVWLIPIDTEINPATAQFVLSRIEEANEQQPLALVFLINTPGGRVDSMQRIVDGILRRAQVPTIAVVEDAFSAGALIAMSAERLAMLPGSSIGAALPITASPIGSSPADEKVNSALRGSFRSVAEERGRDPRVAEAMVDPRIELPGIATSEELVTLSAEGAVEHGIADIRARSLQDALEQFGYGGVAITEIEPSLSERLAGLMTSPLVAALLLAIGIGGLLIELFTPGFGIPGGIGAIALVLFFGGAFIATPAGAIDILILMAGLALIAVEVLVIPGFGVAGILGLLAIFFAIFRIFQEATVPVLGWTAVFGGVLLALAFWLLPNTRFGNVFMLSARLAGANDIPVNDATVAPQGIGDIQKGLVGERGRATSDLRPAGVARFGTLRVDVVTEGDFVPSGTDIVVLRVEGNRVIVRPLEEESETAFA